MGRREIVSEEKFIKVWQESNTLDEVVDRLGVSRSYASAKATSLRTKKKKDLKLMPRGTHKGLSAKVPLLKKLRGMGWTYEEIASELGVTRQAIHYCFQKHYPPPYCDLKDCENCGKSFMIGNRVKENAQTGSIVQVKYCSYQCNRSARNRRNYQNRKKRNA
mgnify:CR=1 FL=1